MPDARSRSLWLRLAVAVAAVGLVATVAGCGSSTSDSTAGATTTNLAKGCPFSGTTSPTSGSSQTDVAASITHVTPRKNDCIDNIQFSFEPGVPAWTVGYQTGPVTSASGQTVGAPGAHLLIVEFRGLATPYDGPTTVTPTSMNYVQQVSLVTQSGGVVEWVISLNQQLQYTTSVSKTPAYFVLGIG